MLYSISINPPLLIEVIGPPAKSSQCEHPSSVVLFLSTKVLLKSLGSVVVLDRRG